MSAEGGKPPVDWGERITWGGAAAAAAALWTLDTFTVHGFLASLYLTDIPTEDAMVWPAGTRVVWWVLFYVAASAYVQRLMWREGVLNFTGTIQMWGASHVSAIRRIIRRVRWWRAGIVSAWAQRRAARPAPGTAPDLPVVTRDTGQDTGQDVPADERAAA